MTETVQIWGSDASEFAGGHIIWSALNAIGPAKRTAPQRVDLAGLVLARPHTTAVIAALGCLAEGSATIVVPKTQGPRDFVCRSGLLGFFANGDEYKLAPSARIVQVRQLTEFSPAFANEITEAWEHEFQGMPAGLRPTLADHIEEMMRNALSHAESPIGCIVAAQVYPSVPSVELAVLDVGQTIRAHLRRSGEHSTIKSDAEAIIHATGEGITGTRMGEVNSLGEPNSGIGLFELRNYCESGGGEVTILSGDAMVTFGSGFDPIEKHFAGGFPGCLVSIRFEI